MSRGDVFFSIFLALFVFWIFRIYQHHFGLGVANGIMIICSFLGSYLILSTLVSKLKFPVAVSSLLSLLPLILVPSVRYGMVHWNNSWAVVFAAIFISGLSLVLLNNWKMFIAPILSVIAAFFMPFSFPENQMHYKDLVILSEKPSGDQLDITEWKDGYWIYVNQELNETTVDRHLYTEAMVHPAMSLTDVKSVLILGNETGSLLEELSKYDHIEKVDFVPSNGMIFQILETNNFASKSRLVIEKIDDIPAEFIKSPFKKYDLILMDLPFEQGEMPKLRARALTKLNDSGLLVIQKRYGMKIPRTRVEISTDFSQVSYETHIPTVGFFGWTIYSNDVDLRLDKKIKKLKPLVPTKWWNEEAMNMMLGGSQYKSQRPSR